MGQASVLGEPAAHPHVCGRCPGGPWRGNLDGQAAADDLADGLAVEPPGALGGDRLHYGAHRAHSELGAAGLQLLDAPVRYRSPCNWVLARFSASMTAASWAVGVRGW